MRKMYKYEDAAGEIVSDRVIECIFKGGEKVIQKKMSLSDAQALVDAGEAIIYDTHVELNETVAYSENRSNNYPAIEEQLDSLYHEIIVSGSLTSSGSWAQSIKAIKDANPKP